MKTLKESTISIGIEVCGGITNFQSFLMLAKDKNIKAEYWQGVYDTLMANNRLELTNEK